jgi:hypothetical protein
MAKNNASPKKHWSESDTNLLDRTHYQRRSLFTYFRRALKITVYVVAGLLFLSILISPSNVDTHSIKAASDARIAVAKIQNIIDGEESYYSLDEIEELSTPVAVREATSFLNLSAGCTAVTRWLNPGGQEGPIEDYNFAYLEASNSWDSYPPAVGMYVDKNWEGIRINVRTTSQPFDVEKAMNFSDALKLLYNGDYVIWYHPRMLEEDPYGLEELRGAVLDKIILEREPGSGAFYLAELPDFPQLSSMDRNVYYTKLGYTHSCIKFNSTILENFY